jgi:hypothetical protein
VCGHSIFSLLFQESLQQFVSTIHQSYYYKIQI